MALLERVATVFPLRDSILFPPFACDSRLVAGLRYVASHVTLLQIALYFVSIFVFFTRQKVGRDSVISVVHFKSIITLYFVKNLPWNLFQLTRLNVQCLSDNEASVTISLLFVNK
jgi:hypothetical protein